MRVLPTVFLGRREEAIFPCQAEVEDLEPFKDTVGIVRSNLPAVVTALKEINWVILDYSFAWCVELFTVPYFPALLF